ncbi:MAG: hypothetical protein H6741_20230 [Alphaproteobacteria bacterium]|nr:hypothetical protein [Alphaproteobacteria bacterium]
MQRDPRTLPPHELLDALVDAVGDAPASELLPRDLSAWREALEATARALPERAQALDGLLFAVRELEACSEGVGAELDGLRRGRVIEQDPISVSFEAWGPAGERHALRVLRPDRARDPVWRRRLEASPRRAPGPPVLGPGLLCSDGDTLALRTWLGGPSLADHLPAEDPADPVQFGRYLAGGLAGLRALHAAGYVHGSLGPTHLIQGPEGVRLAWLDPLLIRPVTPRDDIAALGRAVQRLDPEGHDPIAALARGLAEEPPPSVDMASEMLQRVMSAALADRRHRAAFRSRAQARRQAEGRLLRAARHLALAVPPPAGTWCLRAGFDAVMVVAVSDGVTVRGGPVAGLPAPFLPTVWSPDEGLNPTASRALLRAWATRGRGDEERRKRVQSEHGASDRGAHLLCRWLSAQARLRAVRMLLELGV